MSRQAGELIIMAFMLGILFGCYLLVQLLKWLAIRLFNLGRKTAKHNPWGKSSISEGSPPSR